jgi:hypothetical protein
MRCGQSSLEVCTAGNLVSLIRLLISTGSWGPDDVLLCSGAAPWGGVSGEASIRGRFATGNADLSW